mmetsp:Transcript_5266/g.15385  ORF Transcript_5266/g.15385 Transcript_5266/m.15385 type:complete len:215 (-) Transcript_5266:797-1441(-)
MPGVHAVIIAIRIGTADDGLNPGVLCRQSGPKRPNGIKRHRLVGALRRLQGIMMDRPEQNYCWSAGRMRHGMDGWRRQEKFTAEFMDASQRIKILLLRLDGPRVGHINHAHSFNCHEAVMFGMMGQFGAFGIDADGAIFTNEGVNEHALWIAEALADVAVARAERTTDADAPVMISSVAWRILRVTMLEASRTKYAVEILRISRNRIKTTRAKT